MNTWGTLKRHSDDFQPPQYIQAEIERSGSEFGVKVIVNGETRILYKSRFRNAGRVTLELNENQLGLDPGWYYVTRNGNRENLNHTLSEMMEFVLIG